MTYVYIIIYQLRGQKNLLFFPPTAIPTLIFSAYHKTFIIDILGQALLKSDSSTV